MDIKIDSDEETRAKFNLPNNQITITEAQKIAGRINSSGTGDAKIVEDKLVVRSLLVD